MYCYVGFPLLAALLALFLPFLSLASPSRPTTPTARVLNGTLSGIVLPDYSAEAFLGIPFAQPPIKDLRFRHPQPSTLSWEGVRDASKFMLSCPGYAGFSKGFEMGEDCLGLNVWRPSKETSHGKRHQGAEKQDQEGLPVLVWIYGGGKYQTVHLLLSNQNCMDSG